MALFCHNCGQKLPEEARFCPQCGTATTAENKAAPDPKRIAFEKKLKFEPAVRPEDRITPEHRERVYNVTEQIVIDKLEAGEIYVEDAKEIAQFILDRLDNIQSRIQLMIFLGELERRWPIFQGVSQKHIY